MSKQRLFVFFTMAGNAKEAMEYYEATLPGAKIASISYFQAGEGYGDAGKVLNGTLAFAGQEIMFMDMQASSEVPPFSWATSLLVNADDEAEFDAMFKALADGGVVMMGPEPVMNLRKVSWVTDRFGVTWQVVWA